MMVHFSQNIFGSRPMSQQCSANRSRSNSIKWRARSYGKWCLVTAATTLAISASPASALTSTLPLHISSQLTQESSSRRWVVTDADTLLRESVRGGSADLEALENVFLASSDLDDTSVQARIDREALENNTALPVRERKTIKSTTTMTTKSSKRLSTMPGFASRGLTGREMAFRDGIKRAEARSGRQVSKHVDGPKAQRNRRKLNSEAMYKMSASVPDSLLQFTNEIHLEDRITPKEEVELGTKTQEAIRLQAIKDKLESRLRREPTDEEWCAEAGKINMEAIRQALEEGLEAKNKLVTANLRMVQGVVNIYIRNGLDGQYNAGDMMQEGIMALIRAAEKFEPQRGFRFSTYAMYWIRAAVKRSQIFQSRVITVPQRLYENYKRVLRVEKELQQSLGREPTGKELGDAVGMSETQLERCKRAMEQRCYSLDASISNSLKTPTGGPEKDTLYDLVQSKTDDGGFIKFKRILMREDLIETLNRHLTPHEVDLLLLRFGLMDEKTLPHGFAGPLTIAEVSRLVGLKPDKVRRRINSSLKQLKFLIEDEWGNFEREVE